MKKTRHSVNPGAKGAVGGGLPRVARGRSPLGTLKEYPRPIVGVLIQNPEGKFLIMHGSKFTHWTIPGGHVEMGESIEEAVKREAKEETGLDVHGLEFINVGENVFDRNFYKDKNPTHMIFLDYCAKTDGTVVKPDGREFNEYKWVSLEEIEVLEVGKYAKMAAKKMREKLCSK